MANYTITTAQNIDELTVRTGTRASAAWTRAGTVATVTLTNHQLASGSAIYVTVSSDVAAIVVGAKTLTGAAANTFTFVCLNAGAASGTLTFTATDTIAVNGGTLTIDEDTRFGVNTVSGAALGSITLSSTLGGTVEVDARAVRLIPYNTGSGNVPVSNTVISQGGVTGKLIGVWSAINVAPTAAGAAMPASGFIKVKQVAGGAYAAGALTGIGASATGADVAGWIDLVGGEAATVTVNRLNTFRMRGEWFELGTTSGSRATTYQLPTSGFANYYLPGVWVETAVSEVYEFYPCAGTLTATAAAMATDAVRGRFCWVTVATGLLRFGHDGTNSTGGYLPPAGRKIRIPNILTHNVTLAAQANYALPSATLATRYDFTTTGGGAISMDKVSLNWYPSFTQAFSVSLTNVGIMTALLASEVASEFTWSQVGVGQEAANSQTALSLSLCPSGGTLTDCTFTRNGLASSGLNVIGLSDLSGFTFNGMRLHAVTARGNTNTGCASLLRIRDSVFNDTVTTGGRTQFATCKNIEYNDTVYADHPATTTIATNPTSTFDVGSACDNVVMDGLSFGGLTGMAPYTSLLQMSVAGSTNIKFRNAGTPAAPLSLGKAKVYDATWTRSGTTITVTSTAHDLKVNDLIYVQYSSSAAAVPPSAETVATVPTANSFTFAGVNAGDASGTLTYFLTITGSIVTGSAAAATDGLRLQRIYCDHTRAGISTLDNSNTNVKFEDVWGDFFPTSTAASLNTIYQKLKGTVSFAAQTGQYGAHWQDGYHANPSTTLAGLSWSRVTTTATVTSTNHGKRTGDRVTVTVSSDTAAVALGLRTVTVLTNNTYTITATNAGATSGTLTVQDHTARLGITMNEASENTMDQVSIDAGTPSFTSVGTVIMPTVNDQITWTMPNYSIGYSGFPISDIVLTGGGTVNNFDITYAIDKNDGGGFSAFKNLSYPRAGGSGVNGASTFTVTDATGINVDDYVFGTNIGNNARVTAVNTGTNTVTVDQPNIGTVSGVIRFNALPGETIVAADGFKMKFRIKTTTAVTTAITSLYVWMSHVAADELEQYVLDTATFSVEGLVAGSEVRAYLGTDPTTAVELGGTESSGTSFSFEHSVGGSDGYIVVFKSDYEPIFLPITYESVDADVLVQQRFDRNYENP